MKTRAAVAWGANQSLTIETVDLHGPKSGEVLMEVMAGPFRESQLKPHLLEAVCKIAEIPLTLRMKEGYEHS